MSERTFKRTNWSIEEVIDLIQGQKIVNGNGEEDERCKQYNAVVDEIADYFYDFVRPVTEFGAMGLCNEDGGTYHIGGMPKEHVEEWLKLRNKIQNAIKSLEELPRLVLEDERKNPAWSKTDLWGIERDIVPTIHSRCLQIIADLKDNSPISPKTP